MAICTAFSCSDDDDDVTANGRLFRTMFRCDNNTGKGSDDPYNCTVVDLNDVHLYWYGVDGAAGYHIKWALVPSVSGGAEAWANADTTGLIIGDTILPPDQLDCVIKDLNYQTDYRFRCSTPWTSTIRSTRGGMAMATVVSGQSTWACRQMHVMRCPLLYR